MVSTSALRLKKLLSQCTRRQYQGVTTHTCNTVLKRGIVNPMLLTLTETKMSSFWWNFHHWLHRKLSFWQLLVQPVMKISSKWRHFRFSAWCRPMRPSIHLPFQLNWISGVCGSYLARFQLTCDRYDLCSNEGRECVILSCHCEIQVTSWTLFKLHNLCHWTEMVIKNLCRLNHTVI